MFGRKILFLAAGYVAGNVVGGIYGKHKKRPTVGDKKGDVKQTAQNFIETQKAFLQDLEEKYIPEDKKEAFQEKKSAFLSVAEKYMKKGEKFFGDIKENQQVQKGANKAKNSLRNVSEKGRVAVAKAAEKVKKEDENQF